MGYVEFSSQRANYIFDGTNHLVPRRREGLFEGIDALVVEPAIRTVLRDPNVLGFSSNRLNDRALLGQYVPDTDLAKQIKDRRIPLFYVDPHTAGATERLSLAYEKFSARDVILWFFYSFSKKEIPKEFLERICAVNHSMQLPIITGRDAVSALKIESFVVPEIKRRINKKPRIGVIYGLKHLTLAEYLASEEKRNETLTYHSQRGFTGLVAENIDMVVEINYVPPSQSHPDGYWKIKRSNANLFKRGRVKIRR